MCGLAGVLTTTTESDGALARVVEAMCACIAHRGPDDTGTWIAPDCGIALGFRRLSIIDLSEAGHQPMRSASGRYTLVFNGEVYNFAELRRELEALGVGFRGHSDTEVILAAFERWGIEPALGRFVGMFAMAVWDAATRRLSLVRDRLGIKPLFYMRREGLLIFGSELKALMAHPEFDRALDPDAIGEYLRYLYVPAPRTIFRHARKLLPGHVLTVGADGAGEPVPFWSLDEVYRRGRDDPFTGSDEAAVDELDRLLRESVRLRMRADVPMGALLSGGVDSSTVVALMQRESSMPTRTFSIAFPGTEHDEAAHAAEVARRLETSHTELSVTGDEALAVVPGLPELFDEPLADPSQIPTYLVSRLARRDVTVALSGDGGDELFAGYERYIQGERIIARAARLPLAARQMAGAGVSAVGDSVWTSLYRAAAPLLGDGGRHRLPGQKMRKLGNLLRERDTTGMYRSLLSSARAPEQLLADGIPRHGRVEQLLERHAGLPLLDMMMLVDQQTYLADDLLAKVDRASMAVSLEARVPLLDHRVVEFSWRVPHRMKIRDGRGKWLLRQVLYRYVEPRIVDRPKVGFSVPLAAWLRGPLREWASDLLLSSPATPREHALDVARVRQLWTRLAAGEDAAAVPIWALLMLESWRSRWSA